MHNHLLHTCRVQSINTLIDEAENDVELPTAIRLTMLRDLWDIKRSLAIPPDSFNTTNRPAMG